MEANYYKGIQSIYFNNVISNIIKIGNLNTKNKIILDFGCGIKVLSKKLPQKEIINYDINPNYTEHNDYKKLYFDIVVFNHVLMYMDKKENPNADIGRSKYQMEQRVHLIKNI